MKHYSELKDVDSGYYTIKKKKKKVSDTIYTFDIETSSLFEFLDGWDVFRYEEPPETYSMINKIGLCYLWQFGINDEVYYGRELYEFEDVLKQISDPNITKVIWVHNLSFEFGTLPCILKKYTIEDMCARDIRKPISFHIKELNIDFRCSYMLTNLSLKKASEEYTNIRKLDTLDYTSKVRTPLSTLTDDELMYAEYDCLCVYEIIKYYMKQYKNHVACIPLTSTSEVRKALQKHVDFYYIKHQWDLVPSMDMYLKLMACFQGGYTHANVLHVNRVHKDVSSYDISSSYPSVMVLEKFPRTPFLYIDEEDYNEMKKTDKYCFIFKVKLYDIDSKYYNNYISYSRCLDVDEKTLIYDNGRIKKTKRVELYCTDVDLEIIKENYKIGKIIYEEIYYSEKSYLDIRVIKFILEMYGNKTKLKGVSDKVDLYKKSKAYINSLY